MIYRDFSEVDRMREVTPGVVAELRRQAFELRRNMLRQAKGKGQGYIGQGLGIADLLAALYFFEMNYRPLEPLWAGRDRFLLSTGHYSIALWAVLAEIGLLEKSELDSYGADGSRLEMSTLESTPGVEVIAGSLGHGLGQGVGIALGHRLDGRDARVFVELSDGELQEGSTWEAAMSGANYGLDNLVALIDCNGIQADGPVVIKIEPVKQKWESFGWDAMEINGNDMQQIVEALVWARAKTGRPKAIVLRTTPGFGIPTLTRREKAHFVRVEPDEWDALEAELEANGHE
jgi:transketolase